MSEENKTIHDFDINLICEYFSLMERQGPGSPEMTLKALSFIDNLTNESTIADLGCGTGGQTMVLGGKAPGMITGIDLFPKFIELFNQNAEKAGLNDRVKGIIGSMDNLPFSHEELDLIWAEGSIYNIGFERGLAEWYPFLKKGGFIAVTEASWFTANRPEEIETFWMNAYPQIDTIPNKIEQIQKAGYVPVASFILPDKCWTKHFYELQAKAQETFLQMHPGNEAVAGFIASEIHEMELYYKYHEYYGYVFYIAKKL